MFLVKFSLLVAFGIFILVGVGAMAAYYLYQGKNSINTSIVSLPSPIPSPINRLVQGTSSASPNIQPAAGSNTSEVSSSIIKILSPQINSQVSSPLTVKGLTNSDEILTLQIKDQNGNVLGQGKASPCINTDPCLFEGSVVFRYSKTQTGSLEVYNKYGTQITPVAF